MNYLIGLLTTLVVLLTGGIYYLFMKSQSAFAELAAEKLKSSLADLANKVASDQVSVKTDDQKDVQILNQLSEDKNESKTDLDHLVDDFNKQ